MGTIDKDVIETMRKEQVELSTSNEKLMRRCELDFYCELLSQFRTANKNLENFYQTLNMIGAEKLTQYFKEFSTNYKKEETRQKIKKEISKSHKKAKKE